MFHVEHFLKQFLPDLNTSDMMSKFSFLEKEYLKWNKAINISSIRDQKGFWEKHILDSLSLVSHITKFYSDHEIFDIGSGGGFPGLIMGICLKNQITMVEPIKKKTDFIEHCIIRLGLTNSNVVTGKYEDIRKLSDKSLIVSRALGNYDSMCGYFKSINPQVRIVLMTTTKQEHNFKTRNFTEEYDFINGITENSFKNHVLAEITE